MLAGAHTAAPPADMLQGTHPQRAHFPDHTSAAEHADFVGSEIQKCLQQGAVQRWEGPEPPTVVNGLRVVEKDGKLRLCINPMYINTFMKYRRFKYERVTDATEYLQPDDYCYTTDDKSGYWHLKVAPEMWQYLAFQWQGQLYYWAVLPFGVAPACQIYTSLKQELFRPLRQLGVRMSFRIDDQNGAAHGRGRTAVQCWAVVSVLAALGFTLSLSKCQLRPSQRVHFLGFIIIDAANQVFEVPGKKVAALHTLVGQLEAAERGVTRRQAAQLAGKIMSVTPAVSQAPLHSRLVSRALVGGSGWDDALGHPEEVVQQQAREFLRVLDLRNGRCSWHKGPALQLRAVGDASDQAYAAYLPDHPELGHLTLAFDQQEWARAQTQAFSSTARELGAIEATLRWLQAVAPELLARRRLQYQTDSQPASCCFLGMKGAGECLHRVAAIYALCALTDTDLETTWRPREDKEQQYADALSKFEDGSQWMLNPV